MGKRDDMGHLVLNLKPGESVVVDGPCTVEYQGPGEGTRARLLVIAHRRVKIHRRDRNKRGRGNAIDIDEKGG